MDYPVTTLALSNLIWALVRDQLGLCTLLLPELQAAVRCVKVSVALDQHATGLGTYGLASRQRPLTIQINCLQLYV